MIDYFKIAYNTTSAIIYATFISLNMDVDMVYYLTLMMALDTVLGAVKSVRLGRKFSFKKFVWGFCVKLILILIPMSVALLGKSLNTGDFTIAVHMVIRVLAANEFLSIVTNAYCIKNKKEVKNIDFISVLLRSLRKAAQVFLHMSIKKIELISECSLDDSKEKDDDK